MPRRKKRSGSDPDGRVAIVVTRGDCKAILEFVANRSRLSSATVRRLRTPLHSKTQRHMAMRHGEIAVVYVDHRHDDVVAATEAESDTEPLVAVVRNAAAVFRDRDTCGSSGPFAAADLRSRAVRRGQGSGPGSSWQGGAWRASGIGQTEMTRYREARPHHDYGRGCTRPDATRTRQIRHCQLG